MRKKITLKAFVIVLMSSNIGHSQTPVDLGFATLVWEDNFDSMDPQKWIIIDDCDHGDDQQVYKSSNVSFSGGSMKINLRNEQVNYLDTNIPFNSWACGGIHNTSYNYTSGWVESTNLHSFNYGYIEATIKCPNNFFAAPGFWCWRNEGQTQYSNDSEIDILESVDDDIITSYSTSIYSTNIHTNASGAYSSYPEQPRYVEIYKPNFSFSEWHTYGLEKSPDRIIWYLDHQIVRVLYNHQMIDPERIIFQMMIKNLSNLPVNINETLEISDFKCYDVDYDCQNPGVICGSLFPNNNVIYSTLNVGNNNCSNTINLGSQVELKANNSITLNNNFYCPIGGELFLLTGGCH